MSDWMFGPLPLEQAAEELHLRTADVIGKFGLGDGDRPDWLTDIEERDFDWHRVLFLAALRFWEPALPQRAELYMLQTAHNPVGIATYGGREVDYHEMKYGAYEQTIVPDVSVIVPAAVVAALVREVIESKGATP